MSIRKAPSIATRLRVFCEAEANRHFSMSKRVSLSLTMLVNSASTN